MLRRHDSGRLSYRLRPLRRLGVLGTICLAGAVGCSEGGLVPGDGPPAGGSTGSGGAATGGAPTTGGGAATGGATSTGGLASTGGAASTGGVASTGGASSGGSAAGGTSSGGAATGGAASGGAGTGGGATEFGLTVTGVTGLDNDDCAVGSEAACPLFPQENVATFIGGDNISPAMSWAEGPEGTMSYAVTLYDVTLGNPHWALYDIPAGTLAVPAGLASGANLTTPIMAKQAGFSAGMPSYMGSGACENVYEFRLYALSTATFDVAGANTAEGVIDALEAATPLATSFVRVQSRDYCTP